MSEKVTDSRSPAEKVVDYKKSTVAGVESTMPDATHEQKIEALYALREDLQCRISGVQRAIDDLEGSGE